MTVRYRPINVPRRVRAKPERPPIEYSKQIFNAVTTLTIAVTVFACILMWRTGDTSGLNVLIPAVYAELATATGFYYYKARAENQIKLKQIYGKLAESSNTD